jgi:hypothetical protein
MSTISNMISNITSFSETNSNKGQHRRPKRGISAKAIVTDQFVSESHINVDAFTSTFRAMSLGQLAMDLKEEANTVFEVVDFKKLSSDLNQGMVAASKFVGIEAFQKRTPPSRGGGATSPVEEMAIEVEYVEDPE